MGKDAHPERTLRKESALELTQTPQKKIIFLDVDGVLLNTQTDKIIDQHKLFFTLHHLAQYGHELAVATGIPKSDHNRLKALRACLDDIHRTTGVNVFFDETTCLNTAHKDDAYRQQLEYNNRHPLLQGKNINIWLTLDKMGRALDQQPSPDKQAKHTDSHRPSMKPKSNTVADRKKQIKPVVHGSDIVLVDDDQHTTKQVALIGGHGIWAQTLPCQQKKRSTTTNDDYLYALLTTLTPIEEESQRWLQESPHPTQKRHPQWVFYAYFLTQFMCPRQAEHNRAEYKQQIIHRQLEPKPAWRQNAKNTLLFMILTGCVVASIGAAFIAGGIAIPLGVAMAGVGAKIMVAKLAVFFGMGSAGGMLAAFVKKFRAWRRRIRYRKYLSDHKQADISITMAIKQAANLKKINDNTIHSHRFFTQQKQRDGSIISPKTVPSFSL